MGWSAVSGWAALRGYRRAWLRPDLLAALSLWAVLVPQACAYAQLAGLPAASGLYTALGAVIGYALFGGTRLLNVGPESSVAIVVAGALATFPSAERPVLAAQLALLIAVFLVIGPAASVTLLVYASSVLTARAMAAKEGRDVDAQQEFLGLAAANAASGLLGGFPANGSNSRSALLAQSCARTRLAGPGAAAAVILTLLVLMPLIRDMPQAALGAVIIITAARLVDVAALRRLWRIRRPGFVLAFVTALGVLAVGVLQGIVVGVLVSLLEVLRRAVMPYTAVLGRTGDERAYRDVANYREAETLPGLVIYRFNAPLFFANADVLRSEVRRLMADGEPPVRQIVIDAEAVYDMDTTGAEMLHRLLDDCDRAGVRMAFARARTPVRALLRGTGLDERVRFYHRVADAVAAYRTDYPDLELALRPARPHRRSLLDRLRALPARGRPGS
ncbi:SulP family inorganic anion transporter [Streptosporangium canum]|uniref:SulP family inorganic anion transporter n=1 Tax=Streptosporangium canum TaxID=324952 RepID=UPI003438978C